MYLSFFIKRNRTLDEISRAIANLGFTDIKRSGEIENHRVVIFNGSENNFSYTGHKLIGQAPQEFENCPFLVRAGNNWSMHGLLQIVINYGNFQLPHFCSIHFPTPSDFEQIASEDKKFIKRMKAMKRALEKEKRDKVRRKVRRRISAKEYSILVEHFSQRIGNYDFPNEEEKKKIEKIREREIDEEEIRKKVESEFEDDILKKFEEIEEGMKGKSIGQVKKEILFFLIEKRVRLPWGNPPSGRQSKKLLVDWLKIANRAYPRQRSALHQRKIDRKIKELKDTQLVKLT